MSHENTQSALSLATHTLSLIGFILATTALYFLFLRRSTVAGSIQRYALTTRSIMALLPYVPLQLALSALRLLSGDYMYATLHLVAFVGWGFLLYTLFRDDNWFNQKWKKFKRWVKRLRFGFGNAPKFA